MELVVDIYYAVLKDGSWIMDQYIRNDSLERRRKKPTKTLFLLLRFSKATTPFYVLIFYFCMVWSVLLCSRARYASNSLATHLDQLRWFDLLCLTVCEHIKICYISLG